MADDAERITLHGSPGSPYTRKMLALLRYRRIPYRFLIASHVPPEGMPRAKVALLPTFYFPGPDGQMQAVTDSTPILRRLETERPGRSVRPSDPALAFLDSLLEDFGDEWLTKAMFHYRWTYDPDIDRSSRILPNWARGQLSDEALARFGAEFAGRQIPRLRYVGSNPTTGPTIEEGYVRFVDAFEQHLKTHPFLMGARPGAADFGCFGQLTQLAQFDPTPMALTLARAPRVYAWVSAMEDRSGLEPQDGDWFDPAALPDTFRAVLGEAGRVYAPLLLANAKALQTGAETVEVEIGGRPWVQQPYAYQGKCLLWLREEYAALAKPAKAAVDAALAGTAWAALF